MAVGSFDQNTLDELITAAVDAGLAGEARRVQLLAHLPARFVSKIEEAADPVAQLRADVTHLNAHPRLPDHHQPPLASWLQNAYLLTTPSPEAGRFRELRGRLVGSGRQQEILRSLTRIKRITAPEARALAAERGRSTEPRAGTLLGGRFTLEKQIGRGAVATVWRASDLAAGVQVAVKILHRRWAENPERRDRFFAGARQMAQFAHPHIVPVVLPEGREAGQCYCVLEYLDAGDLEAALREGRIRRNAALRALLRVASGVAAMHASGVMHLDLKPQNILLSTEGRVMLGDFDRVRNAATEGGSTTDTVESIFYLAPETFDETRRPGPSADVFSLGMTALFVLHGDKLPAWIVRRPAALLRRIDCPEALRQVIGRAIELEPGARYPDVESLAVAMQSALGQAPSEALPRVAPIVSAAPAPALPPRVGAATGSLPSTELLTGGRESGGFRALSRSGSMPAISAAEAFEAELASVSGSIETRGLGSPLPAPSVPPPSVPPPEVDLPPARSGELELDDSIDSALEVLDRAAAAALAEEFGRPGRRDARPRDGSSNGSALLPAPDAPQIDPVAESIDLDGPDEPLHSSGFHVSIPGDENRSPWQWVERSGGFMVADDAHGSGASGLSDSGADGLDEEPSRPPWHWVADRPGAMGLPPGGPGPWDAPQRTSTAPAAPGPELTGGPSSDEPAAVEPPFEIRPPLHAPPARPPRPALPSETRVGPAPVPGPEPEAQPSEPEQPEAQPSEPRRPDPWKPEAQPPEGQPSDPPPEGALPLDLPELSEGYGAPGPAEPEDDQPFLPPPPDLDVLATGAFVKRTLEPPRQTQAPVVAAPGADEYAPTDPIAPAAPEPDVAEAEAPPSPAAPHRRRILALAGLGLLGGAAAWWLTRAGRPLGPDPLPEVPRPDPTAAGRAAVDAAPEPAPVDAAAPGADADWPDVNWPDSLAPEPPARDAALPDAAVPDAAPPDAALPDAAPPDAAPPDAAIPDAAPPPPKRRRRRRRKPPRRTRSTPKPPPTPEPLIEIPDEIQKMLNE